MGITTNARRPLTDAETRLAASMFGTAIDYRRVTINWRRWWPFQPQNVCMAPDGGLWFHPQGNLYRPCFAESTLGLQGFFLHELTHVWQSQRGGRWYLPLMRHPFCRYDYTLEAGKPFHRYGIEQQAEIVRHAYLLRQGISLTGKPTREIYEALLPFKSA